MIVLFGPAGSGKSEQGQRIARKYGWRWLSVGQLLRDQNDPKINADLKTGDLFDDVFVTKLMQGAMMQAEADGTEVVLDGYPRNEVQAKWMRENGDVRMLEGAIVLSVPKEELWKRIDVRGRTDDKEGVVEKRWEIFEQNICSILPLLEAENVKITTVDGVGSVEEITRRIEDVLGDWGVLDDDASVIGRMGGRDECSYGE